MLRRVLPAPPGPSVIHKRHGLPLRGSSVHERSQRRAASRQPFVSPLRALRLDQEARCPLHRSLCISLGMEKIPRHRRSLPAGKTSLYDAVFASTRCTVN
jgi:hypothetical protein